MKEDENLKDDEVLEEDTFERAEYDNATPLENIKAMGEFVGDVKKIVKDNWKVASKSDRAKILLILLPFFIGIAIGLVGTTFATFGQELEIEVLLIIGYVLMGTGFGTAILTIFIAIIVQAIKDRKLRR